MDDSSAVALARRVAARLRGRGHRALLAGGCVRDSLLGRPPKDYDIATDAPPGEVAALFPGSQLVGAHFGVVLVRDGADQVEIATFRSDHAYSDGRHPDRVRFETDPRQDVVRRDFTINGLLMDPETGEVFDFVGGRDDLNARVVRAIGDPAERFAEDHLRMLRAVRFAARLGFAIESGTLAAIRSLRRRVSNVSAERVRDELNLILTEGGARRGLELLDESGLLSELLPEVAAMKGVAQPPEFHPEGDVWTHTLLMLERLVAPAAALAWGVLLHDVGKPPTFRVGSDRIRFDGHVEAGVEIAQRILARLRFSNEDTTRIVALVENHMRFGAVQKMRESTLKKFLRLPYFEEHRELHRVDCLSSHRNLDNYDFVGQKLTELPPEQLRPKRLLTGHDLMAAGYAPGPAMGRMLEAVEDAQLEGTVRTRDEALAFIEARFPKKDTA